jgi:hypothetical protein
MQNLHIDFHFWTQIFDLFFCFFCATISGFVYLLSSCKMVYPSPDEQELKLASKPTNGKGKT